MEGRGIIRDNRGMGRNAVQEAVQVNWDRRKKLIPVLYDWFAHHSFVWPSLSCRWGRQVENAAYRNRQHLYLSEQTDGTDHNTLLVMTVGIVKTRVAADHHISKFDEESRSPFVMKSKTIIHPGEVNRVRELPQHSNIVATHTDRPCVFIWDVETQPNRQCVPGARPSRPDLILAGHQDIAEFALAMCPMEPFVLSGGADKSVVLWNINDHKSSLAADQGAQKSAGYRGDTTVGKPAEAGSLKVPTVNARGIFKGHVNTVEDVQFNPSSAQEFCSVGDDSCLILWDERTGYSPVVKVEKAHDADLHCVDWNPNDIDQLLTGSADNTIRMFDRRKLTSNGVASPIYIFAGHTKPILCVQWSPAKKSVFGSSADDGILNIWDYEKIGKDNDARPRNPDYSPGLLFRHGMHGARVVDFHWNPADPWTIASVAQGGGENDRGGSLQLWRMLDFLYRPQEEVIAELEKLKSHIPTCSSS